MSKIKDKNDKNRVADNGYRLPEQLPVGEILTDFLKSKWILGKAIACGGFGEIYLARPLETKTNIIKKSNDYDYVIKVDHFDGPLFCEMNFYVRVAKRDVINKWMTEKDLNFLGIPPFIASGLYVPITTKNLKINKNKKEAKYRFLVMPRFGDDLQKVLNNNDFKLTLKTAYAIGIKILDILEYIHFQGYIHADIKASNLLLSSKIKNAKLESHNEIWLVDFGLVERFLIKDNKVHKPYEEDVRRAHNGTIEFTSRDGHIGCFSRRSDIEILAYNLLSWLSGSRLPWMSNLKDKIYVKNMKNHCMDKLDELFNYAFQVPVENKNDNKRFSRTSKKIQSNIPPGIVEFFEQVNKLKFDEKPNYKLLKNILEKAYNSEGEKYNGYFIIKNQPNSINGKTPIKNKRKHSKLNDDKNSFKNSLEKNEIEINDSLEKLNQSIIIEDDFEFGNELVSKRLRKNNNQTNKNPQIKLQNKISKKLNGKKQLININGDTIKKNESLSYSNGNINKLNKEIVNNVNVDNELLSDLNEKNLKRKNPSRLVKRLQPMNKKLAVNKIQNTNSKTNNSKSISLKSSSSKTSSSKSISLTNSNDKKFKLILNELDNPTPAMKELLNRIKNKKK